MSLYSCQIWPYANLCSKQLSVISCWRHFRAFLPLVETSPIDVSIKWRSVYTYKIVGSEVEWRGPWMIQSIRSAWAINTHWDGLKSIGNDTLGPYSHSDYHQGIVDRTFWPVFGRITACVLSDDRNGVGESSRLGWSSQCFPSRSLLIGS